MQNNKIKVVQYRIYSWNPPPIYIKVPIFLKYAGVPRMWDNPSGLAYYPPFFHTPNSLRIERRGFTAPDILHGRFAAGPGH